MINLLKKLEKDISMNKAMLAHKANAVHFHDDRYVKLDTVYTKEEIDIVIEELKNMKMEKKEVDFSAVYEHINNINLEILSLKKENEELKNIISKINIEKQKEA
ncbi:MAG: hypothetical protein ACRCX2_27495 [Paraclostridium sp.]